MTALLLAALLAANVEPMALALPPLVPLAKKASAQKTQKKPRPSRSAKALPAPKALPGRKAAPKATQLQAPKRSRQSAKALTASPPPERVSGSVSPSPERLSGSVSPGFAGRVGRLQDEPRGSSGVPDDLLVNRSRPRPVIEPTERPADAGSAPGSPDLNFDLLGGAAPASEADVALADTLTTRRTMLTLHQTVGLGLLGMMAGSMITGQLNYSDRFGGPSTGRYESAHQLLVTGTLITFAGAGALAFFAPVPPNRQRDGVDRVLVHEIGMIGATAGMAAEGVLGIWTASREGYSNQSALAGTHLVIGYLTLAFMSAAVGALVF